MTSALLRNRLRVTINHIKALEPSERLRLVVVISVLAILAARWSGGLLERTFMLDPAEVQGTIRVEAYRLGAFLAAIIGFSSFSIVWRSQDIEVLNRLPVPPRAIFRYRLLLILFANLPFLVLAVVAFAPLLWRGYRMLALEAWLYLVALYIGTAILGLAWHIFAGHSVVTPAFATLKQRLAGAMVLPERTFLLYSPFLAAASGFLAGLIVLISLSALQRGNAAAGMIGVAAACAPVAWAYVRAAKAFDRWYYQSLAALAEGEMLGELGESAPGPEYMGTWYVTRLPASIQPLIARDLRQAWRRNRLDHIALLVGTGALVLLAWRRGPDLLARGWLWPALWLLLVAAASQAFRLTRPSSDAPWLWLTLPRSTAQQYLARLLAVFFFSVLIFPGLLMAAHWTEGGWLRPAALLLLTSMGATLAATNLALAFFTRRRLAGILFLGIVGLAIIGSGAAPLLAAVGLLLGGVMTLALLRRLPARMAEAQQAQ